MLIENEIYRNIKTNQKALCIGMGTSGDQTIYKMRDMLDGQEIEVSFEDIPDWINILTEINDIISDTQRKCLHQTISGKVKADRQAMNNSQIVCDICKKELNMNPVATKEIERIKDVLYSMVDQIKVRLTYETGIETRDSVNDALKSVIVLIDTFKDICIDRQPLESGDRSIKKVTYEN